MLFLSCCGGEREGKRGSEAEICPNVFLCLHVVESKQSNVHSPYQPCLVRKEVPSSVLANNTGVRVRRHAVIAPFTTCIYKRRHVVKASLRIPIEVIFGSIRWLYYQQRRKGLQFSILPSRYARKWAGSWHWVLYYVRAGYPLYVLYVGCSLMGLEYRGYTDYRCLFCISWSQCIRILTRECLVRGMRRSSFKIKQPVVPYLWCILESVRSSFWLRFECKYTRKPSSLVEKKFGIQNDYPRWSGYYRVRWG